MKRILIGLTLALALSATATVSAEPSAKVQRQVHTLLNAPEHVPSAAEWQRLGPDAAEVLVNVLVDGKTLALKRGRAASALAHFASETSKQALVTVVGDGDAPWILRGKAARTLAVSYQGDALVHVAPLLGADHKRLREAAIKAVGLVKVKQSRSLLEGRLSAEKDKYLRGLIETTLKRLAKGGE